MSRVRGALPLLAATVLFSAASPSTSSADAPLSFQPQLGVPENMTFFGASPGQAQGEVWATSAIGAVPAMVGGQPLRGSVLVRHALGSGWQIVPVVDEQGNALRFAGAPKATYDGGLAMLSGDGSTIITRDPSGAFVQAPPPGAVLQESSLSETFAAIDEPDHTGALMVPKSLSSTAPGVLHYDGAGESAGWTREPICAEYGVDPAEPCTPPATALSVRAIAASSAQNAWLLATSSGKLMLFKRSEVASGSFAWVQSQTPVPWTPAGDESASALEGGQQLTVTSRGVWVDARLQSDGQIADESLLVEPSAGGAPGQWSSNVVGTWCYPLLSGCGGSLGAPLPSEYASFAWSGPGAAGTRVITGLEGDALLRLQGGGDFHYEVGDGALGSPNAVFTKSGESPEEGWIAGASSGLYEAKVERVSASPEAPALRADQGWPLPFRRPLLAVASQPGFTSGDANAQVLAVGDFGQIARYVPGEGWTPEFLYNGEGKVQEPRLRGVAWPEAGRAYAVGDEGAMWLWRSETGLWEPDPAAPLGLHANLTAIAFSSVDPGLGFAVGKQGTLLAYDKTWTQQTLPPGLQQADFTSVAFAGTEAIATYRMVAEGKACTKEGKEESFCEVGGLIVNRGSGWEVDSSAQSLLSQLPSPTASVLSKVAALPDGGAVAAGPGIVIERDSAGSAWRFSRQPLPEAQNISALAAIRSGSEVRALVSIDIAAESNPNNPNKLILDIDNLPPTGFDQPLALVGPDPLPVRGYLVRETAEGWQDLQQAAYPSDFSPNTATDLPDWPDPVLALDVDPSGEEGWAVGGEASGINGTNATAVQTASALRLGSGPGPPQQTGSSIPVPAGQATFAVGGDAQCARPCAEFADEGIGPDVWLSHATSVAASIPGLHGFLYTGARVAEGAGTSLGSAEFTRELQAYAGDLSAAGSLPVRVAPSPSDVQAGGGLSSFDSVLGTDAGAGSSTFAGTGAYAFDSGGSGGTVRVIVLDYSTSALAPGELGWLAEQLTAARASGIPAIVMGNANVTTGGSDHRAVERVLLEGGASAYLFDSPRENRTEQIGSGPSAIPAFGTGTLGYVPTPVNRAEFLGASGFLLVSLNCAGCRPGSNRAAVTSTLTPNIAQLALDATDGTLLRRSQVALFQGLARRPQAGSEIAGGQLVPDPYVPIPETCIGAGCGSFIEPAYTFTSSRPDIGNFVEPEPNNEKPTVLQGPNGLPIADSHSGLFCAFNAGTTTVSITTGGLTYSEPVTVQAGSVEQPCGTVPLKNPPARESRAGAPIAPLPPSAPAAGSPTPVVVAPPPAPAPPTTPAAPPARPAPPALPFFAKPAPAVPLVAVPLLPPPVLARPIPPSGTSPVSVTSPATAPEEKREEEEAVESARANMAAYDPEDPMLPPVSLIALIVIAAGAGAGIRRAGRSRRHRRGPALARVRAQRYDWMS